MAGGIIINNLGNEQKFATYLQRRSALRDCLRFGVYPNLVKVQALYAAFIADYAPGGALHDEQLWAYYQSNVAPLGGSEADMMTAMQAIVAGMTTVEAAAPGTFGIELPPAAEEQEIV